MEGEKKLVYPQIRKPAPQFESMAFYNGFKKIKLSNYAGKYVVLFFYPLDFTFVCPTEIIAFSDAAAEFRKINCEIIGCSVDSQFTHMEYCKKPREKGGLGKLDIPLLADLTKQIAKDYGCLLDFSGDAGVALRATYIIDKQGILRHMSMNDLPVGRSVDEVMRLVQGFQFSDEFGDVCPAGWKPGKDTLKPEADSEQNAKYWESQGKK